MTAPRIVQPAHPGEASAAQLLTALRSTPLPGFARPVYDAPQLPKPLAQLRDAIAQQPDQPVSDLLLATIRPEIDLRASFQFHRPVTMSGSQTQERVLRNLATGSGEYAFDLPTLQLTGFMAGLFTGVAAGHPATEVNERDLFHGHVIPNEVARDVVIVFHSKEYPDEELPQPKKDMYRNAGLLTPNVASFQATGAQMDERNFIWTLSTNRVFLLSGRDRVTRPDPEFARLMAPGGDPSKLDLYTRRMGTVREGHFGTELFNVNYFPTHLSGDHQQQVFFTPVGQWGVLVYLERQFPQISWEEVEKTYRANDDSLPRTLAALKARK